MYEGKGLTAEQEKEMRIEVIKALKNYKALRVRMKNIQEQHEAGCETLFQK